MKEALALMVMSCFVSSAFSQKKVIDTSVINHWLSIRDPALSNSGKYASYRVVENYKKGTLFIKSIEKKWTLEVKNATMSSFTRSENQCVCLLANDSLKIYKLGTGKSESIANVRNYKIINVLGKEFLFYSLMNQFEDLVVRDLATKKERCFHGVKDYWISENQKNIVLKRLVVDNIQLSWLGLNDFREIEIGKFKKVDNLIFNGVENQIAFITENNETNWSDKEVWMYKKTGKPIKIATNSTSGIERGVTISDIDKFSFDGERIFIHLNELASAKPIDGSLMVDIWNYQDIKLQSQQLNESINNHFLAILNIRDSQIVQIQKENENIDFLSESIDTIARIQSTESSWEERDWNPNSKCGDSIVNCITGLRIGLPLKNVISISPDGRYLIGYDDPWNPKALISYNFITGDICQITKDLKIPINENNFSIDNDAGQMHFAGWLKNEPILFVYDEFDIWKIDLREPRNGLNFTNGFGRRNNIIFRFAYPGFDGSYYRFQTELLSAFDKNTKQNGYFKVLSSKRSDPTKLLMESAFFNFPEAPGFRDGLFPVIKANEANVWLVRKEMATISQNYFVTKNFIEFIKISDVYPEQNVNWLRTELVNFTSLNGIPTQGILYKPEDFDEHKKYPLIIHFYEKKSDQLNIFIRPETSKGPMNIPWFVSRGYLVFTPDIHYQKGEPGVSAYNSIVGAAKYLSQYSYIDSARMGIQGHSFGGYETNYIITQTPVFKAAMSSSGASDLISLYNGIWGFGFSRQGHFEHGQFRFQSTLWQNKEAFIRNSAILYADQVNTPLLMMNNKRDGAIPFTQGVEYFTALRRLGKRVWMLQYDTGDHTVHDENAIDYTVRINQFFDYYLKGISAPIWISKGIKSGRKGIDSGL